MRYFLKPILWLLIVVFTVPMVSGCFFYGHRHHHHDWDDDWHGHHHDHGEWHDRW